MPVAAARRLPPVAAGHGGWSDAARLHGRHPGIDVVGKHPVEFEAKERPVDGARCRGDIGRELESRVTQHPRAYRYVENPP